MTKDLTKGPVMKAVLLFTGPMLLGNLLQQCYNMADTWIVGKALGSQALAAVGSAFTLMTFLTSILIGLCMGAGSLCAIYFGRKDEEGVRKRMVAAFVFISGVALVLWIASLIFLHGILRIMRVPEEIYGLMFSYVKIILYGILFVFLYNYFACMLRAVGNSVVPLVFLAIGTVGNIVLDYLLVMVWHMGVEGAAIATVAAQAFSGIGISVYSLCKETLFYRSEKYGFWSELRFIISEARSMGREEKSWQDAERADGVFREVVVNSMAASVQQSIMNFGILMVQSLVNSFGTVVMAAFTIGVKIDAFAYMPVQEFGNAFSVFIAQNYGAGKEDRMRQGVRKSVQLVVIFCLLISALVYVSAPALIQIFVESGEGEIIAAGTHYLRTEGMFYWGIGLLFLFYGYYRAVELPMMSVVLTVISLGTRVALSYLLAPQFGESMIWYAIPIGWVLADAAGAVIYYRRKAWSNGFVQ
ncbi:MAG: MATE family efflux transporter [Lachnospiraceae bacterium]|nr:MATE family efflux transporter [Lachnospiraceae bacterium]